MTGPKRGPMKNCICKNGDRWDVAIRTPDPITGKTKLVWKTGFTSKAEAVTYRDITKAAIAKGELTLQSDELFEDFLHRWLEIGSLKPKTREGYRYQVDHYVVPRVGQLKLKAVKAATLTRLYQDLARDGGRNGSALGHPSIASVHRTLRSALSWAVKEQALTTNPAARATLPPDPRSHRPREASQDRPNSFDADQLATFLAQADLHEAGAFFRLAAFTGMRRGELLYLRWHHIDLGAGTVTVSGTRSTVKGQDSETSPKAGRTRTLSIDPLTVAVLAQLRSDQAKWRLEAGELWAGDDHVFINRAGVALRPDYPSKLMARLCRDAGLPMLKFHGLRHTHATLLLTANAPVHEVAQRLGHADATVTMRFYAHALPQASDRMSGLFAGLIPASRLAAG